MTRSRFARAVVATGLATLLSLGLVGSQAASAQLSSFSSSANGFALRVTLDFSGLPAAAKSQIDTAYATARAALPADAQAKVPATFPYVIDETFVKTSADATSTLTKALSILGEGFANLTSKQANSEGQTQEHNEALVTIPNDATLKMVEATVGSLKSSVAAGPKVDGSASLASVNATLGNIATLLPQELRDAFTAVMTAVNSTAASAESQVQSTVNTIETTLIGSLPAELQSTLPAAVIGDLSSQIDLPTMVDPLAATGVATINAVKNNTTSQKIGDKVASDAASTLASVNVLGGFLSVGAINLSSHSEANGLPGGARNTAACSLADVRLGGIAGVSLDGKNLYVNVAGSPVAVPVLGTAVDTIKQQVDSVLAQAGVTVKLCDAAQAQAASDGKSANQSVSAFVIEFAPKAPAAIPALGIAQGDTLVKVRIDPTVQTAAQAQVAVPTLPLTGASSAATALFGIAVTAGALLVRRRALAVA